MQTPVKSFCPCRRKRCPRYGRCEDCRSHHAQEGRPVACEPRSKGKGRFKMDSIGNMRLAQKDGVGFLTFPALSEESGFRHAFSTRLGGVSEREFAALNLSFGRGDPDGNVRENYRRISLAAGFDPQSLVFSAQDHHTVIRRVMEEDRGKGIWREKDYQSVDGLITDVPGLTLVTHYADCVPLFFLDPVHKAIGLTHAGWRGTVSSIGPITVERMRKEFGTDPKDLKAAIGPSIGKCCYEVDDAVADRVRVLAGVACGQVLFPKENGRYQLDLWELNRQLLVGAGIPQTQVTVGGVCTCCHSDLLFSHRATGGRRGGLAAFLEILPE